MTAPRSPFACARCNTFTAELHCSNRNCDWLVCLVCESVINDEHQSMASRERYLRELYGNSPSTGV